MPSPKRIPDALAPFVIPIDDLIPQPSDDTPRIGDVEMIARSLERLGQRFPIVYRLQSPKPRAKKRNVIISGNHRWQAAKGLGWTEIAAVDANDLSDDEAKAFALMDNRTSDVATYHDDVLARWVSSVQDVLHDDFTDMLDELEVGFDFEPKAPGDGAWNPGDFGSAQDDMNAIGDRTGGDGMLDVICPHCLGEFKVPPT